MRVKKKKGRYLLFLFLKCVIWIGAAISVGILVWPSFSNARRRIDQVSAIGGYQDGMAQKTWREEEDLLSAAREYNRQIALAQKEKPFSYCPYYEDEVYESVLRVNEDSNIMAYVEAPSGRVYLPIAHGTSDADLAFEAGHLYGTSVPVGGPSTHAVIAAHTGLPEADLFTHLTDMREGDEFYIHVLGEKLIYSVDHINIVLPEECSPYLQIEEGKDYVTLYTCTPYGVNSHRLLVRGRRTGTEVKESRRGSQFIHRIRDSGAVMETVCWGALPILVFAAGALIAFRKRHKGRRQP